jgi:protein-tyrosine phosphatase
LNVINSKLKTHACAPKHCSAQEQNSKPEEASLLAYLRDLGCKFQGNLGSFTGFYGERVRRQAEQLRAAGLYTHYGTDLHSTKQKGILPTAGG